MSNYSWFLQLWIYLTTDMVQTYSSFLCCIENMLPETSSFSSKLDVWNAYYSHAPPLNRLKVWKTTNTESLFHSQGWSVSKCSCRRFYLALICLWKISLQLADWQTVCFVDNVWGLVALWFAYSDFMTTFTHTHLMCAGWVKKTTEDRVNAQITSRGVLRQILDGWSKTRFK